MAEVYKFKVKIQGLENRIWRDIEISSESSVAKLGYSILAAFGAKANHLFCITTATMKYELIMDDSYDAKRTDIAPLNTKLSALKLKTQDMLVMEYDYGTGWGFDIEFISRKQMKQGMGTHYPYILAGAGAGIIEDTSPDILEQFIDQIDSTGILPKYYDYETDKKLEWDYRKFDLEYYNMFYKDKIAEIQTAYEKFGEQ